MKTLTQAASCLSLLVCKEIRQMRTVQDCDEKSMHLSVQRKPLKIWRIVVSLCVCRCTCVSMHMHSLIMFYRVSLSFFSIYISLAGLSISDSCAVSTLCPPDSCWDTGMCCCIHIYMNFGSLNSVLAVHVNALPLTFLLSLKWENI